MNDSGDPDALRFRMQQLRAELGHNVQQTVETARTMLDWKHYVRQHPWVCMAAVTAAGFVMVPKRNKFLRPDPRMLAELAKKYGLVLASPPAAAVQGGIGGVILSMAANAAAKSAMSFLTQHVDRFVRAHTEKTGK